MLQMRLCCSCPAARCGIYDHDPSARLIVTGINGRLRGPGQPMHPTGAANRPVASVTIATASAAVAALSYACVLTISGIVRPGHDVGVALRSGRAQQITADRPEPISTTRKC